MKKPIGLLVDTQVTKREMLKFSDDVFRDILRWKTEDYRRWESEDRSRKKTHDGALRKMVEKNIESLFRQWAESPDGYCKWSKLNSSLDSCFETIGYIETEHSFWEDFCHVLMPGEEIPEKLSQGFDR